MSSRASIAPRIVLTLAGLAITSTLAHGQTDDLAARATQARAAMEAGRFEEAVAAYREVARGLPDHPGAVLNLGLALHSAGRAREAIKEFRRATELAPDLAPAWLMLGINHARLGETEQAAKALGRAVELEPRNALARLESADARLSLGRYEGAVADFRALIELDQRNPKAWLGLGLAYAGLSEAAFESLAREDEASGYADALRAEALAASGQYRSAFTLYRRALEALPSLPGAHSAVAAIYEATGHPEWARVARAKESGRPPRGCGGDDANACLEATRGARTPESIYWRARAARDLAERAYAELLEFPDSPERHRLEAGILSLSGRHAEAAAALRKAIEVAPESLQVQRELARALYRGRDFEALLPRARKLLAEQPESSELNLMAGAALLELRRPAEAAPFLEKAIQGGDGSPSAQALLALAYLDSGRPADALPRFEAALTDDRDGAVRFQMARALRMIGQAERAAALMAESQKLAQSARGEERSLQEAEISPP